MAVNTRNSIVTNGLVLALDAGNRKSYVSGSSTWSDISGNNNIGTLVSSPTFSTQNGGGIVLTGVNSIYVPFVLDTSTNYTIEVVAKCNTMITESSPQNRQTVWSFVSGSSQGYQLLDLEIWNDGVTSFNGDNNLNAASLIGNLAPVGANDNKVYTLSKSGTAQTWYINGTPRASVTQTYTGSSQFFKLGSRGAGATGLGQPWNGVFYYVRIYNRALSSQEILQNYNATKTRFGL